MKLYSTPDRESAVLITFLISIIIHLALFIAVQIWIVPSFKIGVSSAEEELHYITDFVYEPEPELLDPVQDTASSEPIEEEAVEPEPEVEPEVELKEPSVQETEEVVTDEPVEEDLLSEPNDLPETEPSNNNSIDTANILTTDHNTSFLVDPSEIKDPEQIDFHKPSQPQSTQHSSADTLEVKETLPPSAESLVINTVLPNFPKYYTGYGYEGTVCIKAFVSSDGKLDELEIQNSSGHELFDDYAKDKIKGEWEFKTQDKPYSIEIFVYYKDTADEQVQIEYGKIEFLN